MAGAATKAVTIAITAENACASGPNSPRCATTDSSEPNCTTAYSRRFPDQTQNSTLPEFVKK